MVRGRYSEGCKLPVQEVVETLKKDEREGGRGRKWRAAFRKIQQQLIDLENDSRALELVFPQVGFYTSGL